MLKRRPTSHNALLLSGHRRHSTRLRGEGGLHLTSASRPSLTLLLVFSLVPLIRPVRTGGELLVGGRPVRGVQQRPVENGRSQSELAWSATSSPLWGISVAFFLFRFSCFVIQMNPLHTETLHYISQQLLKDLKRFSNILFSSHLQSLMRNTSNPAGCPLIGQWLFLLPVGLSFLWRHTENSV